VKDALGLIPQFFYDLIGRVIPGATFLCVGVALLVPSSELMASVQTISRLPTAVDAVLIILWLFAAYLTGLLLGAIGFALFEDGFKRPLFNALRQEKPGATITEDDLSYVYDFIAIRNPSTGLRMAKLRAERHLCRVLIVGCVILAIIDICRDWRAPAVADAAIIGALGGISAAMFLLQRHLCDRMWRLSANCWLILHDEPPAPAVGDAMLRVNVTPATARTEVMDHS